VPINSVGIQMLIDGLPTIAATGGAASPFAPLGPAATVLKGSFEFDTNEIMNGSQDFRRFLQHRADWFSMLNRGVIKTAVGTSDAHRVDDRRSQLDDRFDNMHVGIARSFILTSAGPAQLSNAAVMNLVKPSYRTPAVLSGLPTALNAMGTLAPATRTADRQRVIVTTGPMISVEVSGAGVSGTLTNPIGRAVTATGNVDIEVTVTGPSWVLEHATEARLVVNGILLTQSLSSGTTSRSATFSNVDLSDGPDGAHTEDTWVVAEAGQPLADVAAGVRPTGEYGQVYPGIPVFALTNPIFFDRDGDVAHFDAVRNDE
jgi:hypothetical protein